MCASSEEVCEVAAVTVALYLMSFLQLAFRRVTSSHAASSSFSRLQLSRLPQRAAFSAVAPLDKSQIETRVFDVLKSFEKVSSEKVRSGPTCIY